jgi:hypothetical protein
MSQAVRVQKECCNYGLLVGSSFHLSTEPSAPATSRHTGGNEGACTLAALEVELAAGCTIVIARSTWDLLNDCASWMPVFYAIVPAQGRLQLSRLSRLEDIVMSSENLEQQAVLDTQRAAARRSLDQLPGLASMADVFQHRPASLTATMQVRQPLVCDCRALTRERILIKVPFVHRRVLL